MIKPFEEKKQLIYIAHDVNKNGAAARNTGVKAAHGEYIAFLDDDDVFLPERIEKLISVAVTSGAKAVYSDVLFASGGKIQTFKKCKKEGFSARELFIDQSLLGTGSNLFVQKEVIEQINGFDEEFTRYQDVEFMIRVAEICEISGVEEFLVIKDYSEARFYPEYSKFRKNQDRFLTKYEYLQSTMSDADKIHCMYTKRRELYVAACASGDTRKILDAYELIKKSGILLTRKEKVKLKVSKIYSRYIYKIMYPLRNIKHQINNAKMKRQLGEKCILQYEKILNAY